MNENFGFIIEHQGKPIVSCSPDDNGVYKPFILHNDSKFIIGNIDLKNKYCYIDSIFSSRGGGEPYRFGFELAPSEETYMIEKWDEKTLTDNTQIVFTGLSNEWDIFLIDCSRYTVSFVLWNADKVFNTKRGV